MGGALRNRLKHAIPRRLLLQNLDPQPPGAQPHNRLLLTFDDGPHRTVTPEVLSRLEAHGARALFFMCGRDVEAHPELARQVLRAGHLIGNHTYSHQTPAPAFRRYLRDVHHCQEAVRRHLGIVPRYFRPPRGRLSVTSLSVPLVLGLRAMHWSLNVRDWSCATRQDALAAAEQLVREASSGAILVLHDDHEFVLPLLEFALPRLVKAGFDLGTAAAGL